MIKPKNTPTKLKTTAIKMITGFESELNCATRISKIEPIAIPKAINKKLMLSACSSCSPVKLYSIPLGVS